jgi:N6-L-threonylcarbamoyladenine synthase
MGSLIVGAQFAKGLALSLTKPLIAVDHLQAHLASYFLENDDPALPCLCLLVSGGHTQLVILNERMETRIIGQTQDDAAGEAFDKAAKILGLPYPGGPLIDRYARLGDPAVFSFPRAKMKGHDFSFSGLKTSILYFVRGELEKDAGFVEKHRNDLCAGIENTICITLLEKLKSAAIMYNMNNLCLAGGVSANTKLRTDFLKLGLENHWKTFVPKFEYCTDNAAMIAKAAEFKYKKGDFSRLDAGVYAR